LGSHARNRALTRRDLLRNGGAGAAGLMLLGAAGCDLGRGEDEGVRGGVGGAGSPEDGSPNVVLVIIDTLRTDHVGAYGGDRARTPNLDAFARESLRFTRAYPESMPTVPARRAMMTGKRAFPFRNWHSWADQGLSGGPGSQPIDGSEVTFHEELAAKGYRTAYVTDNPHIVSEPYDAFRKSFDLGHGIDGQVPVRAHPERKVSQRFANRYIPPELVGTGESEAGRMREYLTVNRVGSGRREDDFLPARVFRSAIDYLERRAKRPEPFVLVVDSFDAHEPWDPPYSTLKLYADVRRGEPQPIQPFHTPSAFAHLLRPGTLDRAKALYSAEITFVDRWFGELMDRLERTGLSDNTWVVTLSDHGVLLGERDIIGKSHSNLHRELWKVPFMIRHPQGKGAGETSDHIASTHDIAPTILAAAGAQVPRVMEGQDLTVLFEGKRPQERTYFTSALKDHVCAFDDDWLLICNNQGQDQIELYDRRADPAELRDVASRHPDQVKRLWRKVVLDAGGPLPNFGGG
jgi:arylsulfatase A-like enzyme